MQSTPYPAAIERYPRVRQSRLATFDRCALSARFSDLYERDWSTSAQARGTIFHRVAAECLKAMITHTAEEDRKAARISPDDATEVLREVIRQRDVDDRCGICGAPARYVGAGRVRCEKGHDHGTSFQNINAKERTYLRWVTRKWAAESTFDLDSLVDIEQRIEATATYEIDGVRVERKLTGQLDVLFVVGDAADWAVVLDWKESWGIPAPKEVGADGYFQQRFYAWLVLKNYPSVKRVTLREVYPRVKIGDDPSAPGNVREADVFRDEMDDLDAEFSALVERFDRAFEEGNYPPTPGHHCGFCPRPMECPIFPDLRGEGAISDEQTAQRFAREAVVARRALDSRLASMSAWASVHGGIPISDHKGKRVWAHVDNDRTERPSKRDMQAALDVMGVKVIDLDRLYKTKTVTRFEDTTKAVTIKPHETDESVTAALAESIAQRERGV